MRNISFMLTTQQVRDRQKTVTRRLGWRNLKAGELLCGVEKGMGLKAGEKIIRLAVIRVVGVRFEPLRRMTDRREIRISGFPVLRACVGVAASVCQSYIPG